MRQTKTVKFSGKPVETITSRSFAPILGRTPRLLILGTMPGQRSLESGQYYAHPQNQFWKIMGDLYGASPTLPYDERTKIISDKGIAVWDVVQSCKRVGSMDADMKEIILNDFVTFFSQNKTIQHVIFDSGKAEQLYNKHIFPMAPPYLLYDRVPSPSPAYASLSYKKKLEIWRTKIF